MPASALWACSRRFPNAAASPRKSQGAPRRGGVLLTAEVTVRLLDVHGRKQAPAKPTMCLDAWLHTGLAALGGRRRNAEWWAVWESNPGHAD